MGRRFPSIRLKSKDKKDSKKHATSCTTIDKAVKVNETKGSCAKAVSAIYGDPATDATSLDGDFESNIYENGHIVIKQDLQRGTFKFCGAKKTRQYLVVIVILSVIIFILTGASLLITRGGKNYDFKKKSYILLTYLFRNSYLTNFVLIHVKRKSY